MCEDHGPTPKMLAILDASSDIEVAVDGVTFARFQTPPARLPVVVYPSGDTDCVLAPPEPRSWTPLDVVPNGNNLSFRSSGQSILVRETMSHGTRLLAGRSVSGELVRLRISMAR